MSDRIIRESICISDTLNQLSDFEERFWHRLIVNCDDYGRFDARPAVLKGRLFPLLDGKTQKDMSKALSVLASVGLVELYEVDGKPFLHVVKWDKYQRIRAKRSKFPAPDGNSSRKNVSDNTCCQVTTHGNKCSYNPIQSEINPNPKSNPNPSFSAELETSSTPPPVISMPLNDGGEWPVYQEQVEKWQSLYPAVDVMQQLRNMCGWLEANPKRKKTQNGISRFVTGWLSREQDRGWRPGNGKQSPNQKSWMEIGAELEEEGVGF